MLQGDDMGSPSFHQVRSEIASIVAGSTDCQEKAPRWKLEEEGKQQNVGQQ